MDKNIFKKLLCIIFFIGILATMVLVIYTVGLYERTSLTAVISNEE